MVVTSIVIYILIFIAIGVYASGKVNTDKDYILAGRKIALIPAIFSVFATWFGAETIMGSSGAISEAGLAGGRADPFGYSITLMLMGLFIAYRMRSLGLVTLADFFEQRFSSRKVVMLCAFVMISTSIIWSAAQLFAFGKIISSVANIDHHTSVMIATVVVIIYTILGGMLGSVISDLVQGIIIIIGLMILLIALFDHTGGVLQGFSMIEAKQLSFSGSDETYWKRLDVWMIPILGSLVSQEAISRILATKSPKVARKSVLIASALYFTIGCIPLLLALIGSHIELKIEHRDQFIVVLAGELLSPVFYIIFIGALVSAILSTINSNFLSMGAVFSHNILQNTLSRLSEKARVLITRLSVSIFGLISYMLATKAKNIYDMLMTESSFGTSGLFVVMCAGLWLKKTSSRAAALSVLSGIILTFLGDYLEWQARFITSIAICVAIYAAIHLSEVLFNQYKRQLKAESR